MGVQAASFCAFTFHEGSWNNNVIVPGRYSRSLHELEQIQFLLGHASVLTTERYLGCKQYLEEPVMESGLYGFAPSRHMCYFRVCDHSVQSVYCWFE